MPALDRLQKERGGEGFEVVAVNVDAGDDTKPKRFLEETGVGSLASYRDNTLGIFNELKKRGLALGLPVTLLIDARRMSAGQYERPGGVGERRRQGAARRGGIVRPLSVSVPDARRDSRRNRGRSCARASPPRHI